MYVCLMQYVLGIQHCDMIFTCSLLTLTTAFSLKQAQELEEIVQRYIYMYVHILFIVLDKSNLLLRLVPQVALKEDPLYYHISQSTIHQIFGTVSV